jgi:hypothetical protein
MKTVSMFLTTAILLAGPALQAKGVKVADALANDLKTAIVLTNLNCPGASDYTIKSNISNAQVVLVDEAAQPALIFQRVVEDFRIVVTVTTSADYKQILKLVYEEQRMGQVNLGTLLKPRIVKDFVTQDIYRCSQY